MYERRNADILASNRGFRRYVLRELERSGAAVVTSRLNEPLDRLAAWLGARRV